MVYGVFMLALVTYWNNACIHVSTMLIKDLFMDYLTVRECKVLGRLFLWFYSDSKNLICHEQLFYS